jgi:NTE family protein
LVLSGGGPLAVAWECGVAAGLARAGVALGAADFILGTSAGAIVGAQLAAGRDPVAMADAIMAETDGVPPPGAQRHYQHPAVMKLPDLFALSQTGEAGCIEVGSYAMAASTIETETPYIERMQLAIGMNAWPRGNLGLVAVSVADGRPEILRRESGATIAAAVAASCCLPGLSPPVTILGRRYMDGGMRSTANADLAAGFGSVLVLCFHLPGRPGERALARIAAQSEALAKTGTRVCVISPDAAGLAAIGPRHLDLIRRPEVARAACAQGSTAADVIGDFGDEFRRPAQDGRP